MSNKLLIESLKKQLGGHKSSVLVSRIVQEHAVDNELTQEGLRLLLNSVDKNVYNLVKNTSLAIKLGEISEDSEKPKVQKDSNNKFTKNGVINMEDFLDQKLSFSTDSYNARKEEVLEASRAKAFSITDEDVYDSLPHIREAVASKSPYPEVSLANHSSFGNVDTNTLFQKFLQGRGEGEDYLETGRCYMFMTKPNLNLTTNLPAPNEKDNNKRYTKDVYNTLEGGFTEYVARNFPELIRSLTQDSASKIPNFIPLLFNNFKGMSVDDFSLAETTVGETFRGYSQKLPTNSVQSQAGGTLSITYAEKMPTTITYLHKVWFDYCEKVKWGAVVPSDETIKKKEIDYDSSIYFFVVGPDGETILFWGKYTGVVPVSLPYSVFGAEVGSIGVQQVSISYLYSHREFLQPEILQDFNDVFNGGAIQSIQASSSDIEDDPTMYPARFKVNTSNSAGINDYGIPDSSDSESFGIKIPGYANMYKGNYNSVGVIKREGDKNYRLVFYDSE